MPRSTTIFISILLLLAGLLGYNYFAQPFATRLDQPSPSPTLVSPAPSSSPEPGLSELELSPRQKIAFLLAAPLTLDETDTSSSSAQLKWIEDYQPKVVTLFGNQITTTTAQQTIDQLTTVDPQVAIAVDHEGGAVQRLNGTGFSVLPSWHTLCQQTAEERKAALLKSAKELKQVGVDIIFGPVVDVGQITSGLSYRVCSTDPQQVTQAASEAIAVYQSQELLPVIKHFPGIGSVNGDLHRQVATVELTEDDLMPFDELLTTAQLPGVMTAHVRITDSLNDQVCSLSSECVTGFRQAFTDTVVFTDALDMAAAGVLPGDESRTTQLALEQRAEAALRAGNDVLVFGKGVTAEELTTVLNHLLRLYEDDGEIRQRIDQSVTRVSDWLP